MLLFEAPTIEKLRDRRDVGDSSRHWAIWKDSFNKKRNYVSYDEQKVRERVAEALVKIGSAAVEPLLATLKDSDSLVQMAVAKALGQIGDARAVEPLIELIKIPGIDVWWK